MFGSSRESRHRQFGASSDHVHDVVADLAARDAALIARLRTGDASAFDVMYLVYYEPLWTFVNTYVQSDAIAEDVVQDVFRHVWEHGGTLQVRSSLRGLLFSIAHNRALNVLRHARMADRRVHERIDEDGAPGMGTVASDPVAAAEAHELAAAIMRVVETFPERRREVFLLKWRDGLSYGEIADVLGMARKTVEMHVTNAYKVFREELSAYFS